jgi:hypothetical protein
MRERTCHWVGRGLTNRWTDVGNWASEPDGRPGYPKPTATDRVVISGSDGTVDLFGCPGNIEVKGFSGIVKMPQGGEINFGDTPTAEQTRKWRWRKFFRFWRSVPLPDVKVSKVVGFEDWPVKVRLGLAMLTLAAGSLFVVPVASGGVGPYFWVGGTGTWDNAATIHWSATSGGASGAGPPTSSDAVVFNASSGLTAAGGTVTITATAACGGCTISAINHNNVIFSFSGSPTWGAGTYSFQGNSDATPIILQSATTGTTRTVTINGTHGTHTDVHFMDITLAGSAGTLTGTRIGDCRGNSGITFTTSAAQVWQGTTGGNWSSAAKWTSRVPLPQDDVSFGNAFAASQTVTADMRRIGRTVDFTGSTGSPGFTLSFSVTMFGSLDLSGVGTVSAGAAFTMGGRSTYTIRSNSKVIRITLSAPNGSYSLLDHLNSGGNALAVSFGSFDAAGFNVTAFNFSQSGNNTTVAAGSGTWTVTGTGTVWSVPTSAATYNGGSETIVISDTTNTAKTFAGGNRSYGTLRHIATGTAGLTMTGNNTFVNYRIEVGDSARTVTLPASGSQTVTGTFTYKGLTGQNLSLVSSAPGTKTTINVTGSATIDTNAFTSQSADVAIVIAPTGDTGTDVEAVGSRVVNLTDAGATSESTLQVSSVSATDSISSSDVISGRVFAEDDYGVVFSGGGFGNEPFGVDPFDDVIAGEDGQLHAFYPLTDSNSSSVVVATLIAKIVAVETAMGIESLGSRRMVLTDSGSTDEQWHIGIKSRDFFHGTSTLDLEAVLDSADHVFSIERVPRKAMIYNESGWGSDQTIYKVRLTGTDAGSSVETQQEKVGLLVFEMGHGADQGSWVLTYLQLFVTDAGAALEKALPHTLVTQADSGSGQGVESTRVKIVNSDTTLASMIASLIAVLAAADTGHDVESVIFTRDETDDDDKVDRTKARLIAVSKTGPTLERVK